MTRARRFTGQFAAFIFAGVVLWLAIGSVSAAPPARYEDFLAQAKQDAAAVDFTALRYAYAESGLYNPYDADQATMKQSMVKSFTEKDCANALKLAQTLLEKNYLNIDSHIASALCHESAKQAEPAKHHHAMARGLINSIMASGDGKTVETAFAVIAIDEEYRVLSMLGLRKTRQALVAKNGHKFDALTAIDDKSGGSMTLYFNIDRLAAWAARQTKSR
jgi:hypothetical protein